MLCWEVVETGLKLFPVTGFGINGFKHSGSISEMLVGVIANRTNRVQSTKLDCKRMGPVNIRLHL